MNRSEIIHKNFIERVQTRNFPVLDNVNCSLSEAELLNIFESQAMSRLLDIESRRLAAKKQSFYTIGSSGHEGNAVLGHVFRSNDPAFLHYRSCAFMVARNKKHKGGTPLYDTLLSFMASREDPISGGRHKVLGSKELWIPPQTSTIASHLPKAMGMAHAIGLYKHIEHEDVGLNHDSIVMCNFGDASVNHSTAQGAINTAAWASYQMSPMPIIFVCEDNGIGISTHTPNNWINASYSQKPGLKYISCNGLDIRDVFRAAQESERYARKFRKPVFLHMKTIRLMGHAGSDIETSYHSNKEISDTEAHDPLLYTASILNERGISSSTILDIYGDLEKRISYISKQALNKPKLTSSHDVMASIWPPQRSASPTQNIFEDHKELFKHDRRHLDKPIHLARHINLTLSDIMQSHANTIIFGEDVAKKGGVYGVTQNLFEKFGQHRVTNTLLDEQSILGLAIGLAHAGYLPIAEIQYLAYVHNAEDQIRGEASSLSFFSNGQFTNPMVIRIAGFAYQKGFGGHFHNDNSFSVFRDIPGIIVVTPSNGRDATKILWEAVRLACEEQKIVVIIEPIALYMTMDLHEEGDGLWATHYEAPALTSDLSIGDIGRHGTGNDLAIVSYANGYYLSRKAEKILSENHHVNTSVFDLRWLHPLPVDSIIEALAPFKNILIVDECRQTGSISEALVTHIYENLEDKNVHRLNAEDCFIPLGDAANLVLPSVETIVAAALNASANQPAPTATLKTVGNI